MQSISTRPLTTHHSPLTTHHSPLTTHHSPLTFFCPLRRSALVGWGSSVNQQPEAIAPRSRIMSVTTKEAAPARIEVSDSAEQMSAHLLEGVQGRDPQAWGRLVELCAPLVERWSRRRRLPAEDIQDVAQDV